MVVMKFAISSEYEMKPMNKNTRESMKSWCEYLHVKGAKINLGAEL